MNACEVGLLFVLGMRRADGLGRLRGPTLVGLALYLAVWLGLVASYVSFAADPAAAPLWWGFPLPTAILLFAFWPFPLYFVALYLWAFDAQVLRPGVLERFRTRAGLGPGDAPGTEERGA